MGLSKVISGVTAFLTTGVVGTGVSYFSSKATIGDVLLEKVISVSYISRGDKSVWNEAYDQNKVSSKISSITNGQQLESWCKSQYVVPYKDLFKQGDKEILDRVEKLCSISIRSMLVSGYNSDAIIDKSFEKFNNNEKKIWEKFKYLLENREKVVNYISLVFLNVLEKNKDVIQENAKNSVGDFKKVEWDSNYIDLCKKLMDGNFLSYEDESYKAADNFCTTNIKYVRSDD